MKSTHCFFKNRINKEKKMTDSIGGSYTLDRQGIIFTT